MVRDIFRMFADGIGYVRMTKILREKGALNPQAYPATSSKKAAFLMGMLLFCYLRPEAQSRVAAGYLRFLARKYFPIRVEKTPILAVRAVLRFIKKVLRYRFRGWHFQGAML